MSMRYKGGVISATADNPGNGGSGPASGVWTLTDQAQAVAATQWPVKGAFMRGVSSTISCTTPASYSAAIDQDGNAYYSGTWGGVAAYIKLNTDNTFATPQYISSDGSTGALYVIGQYNNSMYFQASSGSKLYQFTSAQFTSKSIPSWTFQAMANGSASGSAMDSSGNIYTAILQTICCSFPTVYLSRTKQDGTKYTGGYWSISSSGATVTSNANGNIGVGALTRSGCTITTQFTYFNTFDSGPAWCLYTSSWSSSVPSSYMNSDGSVILARSTIVAKFSSTGSLVWQRNYTVGSGCDAIAITCDVQNNIYVVFSTTETIPNGSATLLYIVKYNSSGVIQWQRKLTRTAAPNTFTIGGITVDYNGSYYLGIAELSTPTYKALLLKLPINGSNASTTTFDSFNYTTGTGTDSAGAATFTNPATSAVAWYGTTGGSTTYGWNRAANKTLADSTQTVTTYPFT